MIKKIISIKNVGRFKNAAAAGNQGLKKYVLLLAANGFGKTTLCAILRSLQTGDPVHVVGRKTLGVADAASVHLLLDSGSVHFDGEVWTRTIPALAIFDGTFVAENVHSGEVVEIDHKRNLYRIIIGQEGVRLAEEDTRLAGESRTKTGEVSAITRAIQPHIPTAMQLDQFIALPAEPDIDAKIAEQERTVEAIRQASQIKERPVLSEISVPTLPDSFTSLLAKTIDSIAQDAEKRLVEHLVAHGMANGGGNWIAEGMGHADGGTCPFCGQGIRDLSLIAVYRTVFSDAYKALKAEIAAMRTQIAQLFGDGALGRLNTLAEQNKGGAEFWRRYCAFDAAPLALPVEIPNAMHGLGQAAFALLDRKARTPLEVVPVDDAFSVALTAHDVAEARAKKINDAIRATNVLSAAKKAETGAGDVRSAEGELARRKAIRIRHSAEIARCCTEYAKLAAEKDNIDKRKSEIRAKLDAYTEQVVQPYEQRINKYLDDFNAGFSITETKHSYPGGVATSSYQLLINSTPIEVGDGRTPPNKPSFKNTLSAGDRSTLALAFFLAHLERDVELARKIIVFDDPFNSQDAFRRLQTVHEIVNVARNCIQVMVLSHDAPFLQQIWDKAPAAERTALTIADHRAQGSKIMAFDLERACQGRTAIDIDDLQTFLRSGTGNPLDIIRKMRVVLETYCWITYPACFQAEREWLGEIVRKIREGGNAHPAQPLYDELDQINDYTSQYHHGKDLASIRPDQIDSTELTGHTRKTLRIVNALQA